MPTLALSEAALALFRLHVERGGHLDVDDAGIDRAIEVLTGILSAAGV